MRGVDFDEVFIVVIMVIQNVELWARLANIDLNWRARL